jgi:hypothetical protein
MKLSDLIPNAQPVEYAYASIWDSWTEYGALIGTIKNYGITVVPDDWVPWFIWDLGLEDVVPYIRDYRTVLAAGPAWQRTRGTPDGIATGISFVQSSGVVAASDQRHNWWEFQVAFAEPASDLDQIQQLDGIIRLSKAAEDELFRMYSPGYDFRPVRMDMHRADDGLMDGYSGEPLWENGPLISFGWSGSNELEVEPALFSAAEVTVGDLTVVLDGMRMDMAAFGERPPAIVEADLELEETTQTESFAADSWPTAWPTSWAEAADAQLFASDWEMTP